MVRAVMREIRERFKDFQNAHEICHERFSSETDKEASSKYYRDVVDQIATLEGEVATLLARVEQEISSRGHLCCTPRRFRESRRVTP